jgi:hypothetical protein
MGTDSHFCIQVFEKDGLGLGRWTEVPYQTELYEFQKERGMKEVEGIAVAPSCLRNRDYDLFAILAGVRRPDYGFLKALFGSDPNVHFEENMNTPEPDGWLSIVDPSERVWPDDFDEDLVLPDPHYPDEGPRSMGYHDKTYVTIDELRLYPWDKSKATLSGVVSGLIFQEMRQQGRLGTEPPSYCGGVGGPGVVTYESVEEYEKAEADGTLASSPYVKLTWENTARAATGDWIGEVLPWLEKLAAGRPLRLILGFDS